MTFFLLVFLLTGHVDDGAKVGISSDQFALRVCKLGTTRKITAGGKVVYMCRQKTGSFPADLALKRHSTRQGISAECRQDETAPRGVADCRWKCVPDLYDDCTDFLAGCKEFGGRGSRGDGKAECK